VNKLFIVFYASISQSDFIQTKGETRKKKNTSAPEK